MTWVWCAHGVWMVWGVLVSVVVGVGWVRGGGRGWWSRRGGARIVAEEPHFLGGEAELGDSQQGSLTWPQPRQRQGLRDGPAVRIRANTCLLLGCTAVATRLAQPGRPCAGLAFGMDLDRAPQRRKGPNLPLETRMVSPAARWMHQGARAGGRLCWARLAQAGQAT